MVITCRSMRLMLCWRNRFRSCLASALGGVRCSTLKGAGMQPLLSKVGRRNWNCRCCNPDKPDHGRLRQREKRGMGNWLDEYEDRPEVAWQGCPKGGLECSCNKLPDECPHMDETYWDNDCYGRYAIGEAFDLNPSWTLVSLRPMRNRT
jgi:hypothetical protein